MRTALAAAVACLTSIACGSSVGPESIAGTADSGTVNVALTVAGSDGQQYRLLGASLAVTGPTTRTIPADADNVSAVLKAGTYNVLLEGAWRLEAASAPGVPVEADLVSPNPQSFSISVASTTPVTFKFKPKTLGQVAFTPSYVTTGGFVRGSFTLSSLQTGASAGSSQLAALIRNVLVGSSIGFSEAWDSSYETTAVDQVPGPPAYELRLLRIHAFGTAQFGGDADAVLTNAFWARHDQEQWREPAFYAPSYGDGSVAFRGMTIESIHYADRVGPLQPGDRIYEFDISGDGSDLRSYGATTDAEGFPVIDSLSAFPVSVSISEYVLDSALERAPIATAAGAGTMEFVRAVDLF